MATSEGLSSPLRRGCHSCARSGRTTERLRSGVVSRREQYGQPVPLDRARSEVAQLCPAGHRHQIRRGEPGRTSVGDRSPLRVGCHAAAKVGATVAKQVSGAGRR